MDAYLESLVIKNVEETEEVVEPAEVNAVEQQADATDSTEAISPVAEEVNEETQEDSNEVTAKVSVKHVEEPKHEARNVVDNSVNSTSDNASGYTLITDTRVYNFPDINSPSRIISGQVIFEGEVAEFNKIRYMKHGFGLVTGYIKK